MGSGICDDRCWEARALLRCTGCVEEGVCWSQSECCAVLRHGSTGGKPHSSRLSSYLIHCVVESQVLEIQSQRVCMEKPFAGLVHKAGAQLVGDVFVLQQ